MALHFYKLAERPLSKEILQKLALKITNVQISDTIFDIIISLFDENGVIFRLNFRMESFQFSGWLFIAKRVCFGHETANATRPRTPKRHRIVEAERRALAMRKEAIV